jgi:hypothetical protein
MSAAPSGGVCSDLTMPFRNLFALVAVLAVVPLGCTSASRDATGNAVVGGAGTGNAGSAGASGGASGSPAAGGNAGTRFAGQGGTGGVVPRGAAGDGGGAGLGATGGADAGAGSDGAFVPEDLPVTNLSGEESGFNVIASTLARGSAGPELYAALENDRDISGCSGSVSFELFDYEGQSIGSWVAGLYSEQLFRHDDGTGGLVSCVDPGHKAMAAVTDLPTDLAIADVGAIVYQLTYFDRSILPFGLIAVDTLAVTNVESSMQGDGSVFTGTLENGLDVPIKGATVAIFPLDEVGRPVGFATSSETADVAAGDSWSFETTAVSDVGVDFVAYPSGSVSF